MSGHPAIFWLYHLFYTLAIDGAMIALLFVRSGWANVVMLAVLILLITISYWDAGMRGPMAGPALGGSRLTHLC